MQKEKERSIELTLPAFAYEIFMREAKQQGLSVETLLKRILEEKVKTVLMDPCAELLSEQEKEALKPKLRLSKEEAAGLLKILANSDLLDSQKALEIFEKIPTYPTASNGLDDFP